MPSEIIIPGFTAIVLLLMVALSVTGALTTSLSLIVNAVKEAQEDSLRKMNRVIIKQAIVNYRDGVLEAEILVENDGSNPVYKFEECDLILDYFSSNGMLKSVRLSYSSNWFVEKVFLVEDYSVSFTEHPLIDRGEVGEIRVLAFVNDLDVEKPLRIVFTTHYGSSDSKWVFANAQG
uniref:Flagellin n=1 Tax=Thermosphaera aggregans TaxID=54254 RepID=A0A7C2BLP5_9CREN